MGAEEGGAAEKAKEVKVEGPSSSASLEPKEEVGWKGFIEEPPKPVGWEVRGAGEDGEVKDDEKGVEEAKGGRDVELELPLMVETPLDPP